jgi:hypothetical protein
MQTAKNIQYPMNCTTRQEFFRPQRRSSNTVYTGAALEVFRLAIAIFLIQSTAELYSVAEPHHFMAEYSFTYMLVFLFFFSASHDSSLASGSI